MCTCLQHWNHGAISRLGNYARERIVVDGDNCIGEQRRCTFPGHTHAVAINDTTRGGAYDCSRGQNIALVLHSFEKKRKGRGKNRMKDMSELELGLYKKNIVHCSSATDRLIHKNHTSLQNAHIGISN